MNHDLFVCDCGDIKHQVVISHDPEPDYNEHVFMSVSMAYRPFLERLINGIKYVFFGWGAEYGEVVLDKKEAEGLANLIFSYTKGMPEV